MSVNSILFLWNCNISGISWVQLSSEADHYHLMKQLGWEQTLRSSLPDELFQLPPDCFLTTSRWPGKMGQIVWRLSAGEMSCN